MNGHGLVLFVGVSVFSFMISITDKEILLAGLQKSM